MPAIWDEKPAEDFMCMQQHRRPRRGSLTHKLLRGLADPGDARNYLRRCTQLARHTGLPYAERSRYRRELRANREFHEHLERCLVDIEYSFSCSAELYELVRATKPRINIETEVAAGLSSVHVLVALDANGMGMLHSIDLPNVQHGSNLPAGPAPGWMVPDGLRQRWHLHIGDSRTLLAELLRPLHHVDLFLHDSDHSYETMLFELEHAFPKLADGGLLLSDDTQLHTAWDDFCAKHGLRPARVFHLGVTRKPFAGASLPATTCTASLN
jgi:predicted O-methyltransferase YrrM